METRSATTQARRTRTPAISGGARTGAAGCVRLTRDQLQQLRRRVEEAP